MLGRKAGTRQHVGTNVVPKASILGHNVAPMASSTAREQAERARRVCAVNLSSNGPVQGQPFGRHFRHQSQHEVPKAPQKQLFGSGLDRIGFRMILGPDPGLLQS